MNSKFWDTPTGITVRWIGFIPSMAVVMCISTFIIKILCRIYNPDVAYNLEQTGSLGDHYIKAGIMVFVLTIIPFMMGTLISCFVCPNKDIAFGIACAVAIGTIALQVYLITTRDVESGKTASIVIQSISILIALVTSRQQINDVFSTA